MRKVVGYFAMAAQLRASDHRARQRKLIRRPQLRDQVVDRIKDGWNPEQIAGQMRIERAPLRVCQKTIYRHIYAEEGMRYELWWYLPTHRKAQHPRRARKRRVPRFPCDISILFRTEAAAQRSQFGHWEAVLMLFRQRFGSANVTSLFERVSRFTVLLRNAGKQMRPEMDKVIVAIRALPDPARKSVTFERGTEFVSRSTCKPRSTRITGSATPLRLGRKARSRTPIAALAVGCPESAKSATD